MQEVRVADSVDGSFNQIIRAAGGEAVKCFLGYGLNRPQGGYNLIDKHRRPRIIPKWSTMKTNCLAAEIEEFLDDYVTEYINPHGVSISMYDDSFVVACSLEEGELSYYEAVEILFQCQEVKNLIATFAIINVRDLGKIKRQGLLKLYQNGKASMFCDIGDENVDSLYYTRHGAITYISLDNEQVGSSKKDLTTAQEFIEETRVFYKRA